MKRIYLFVTLMFAAFLLSEMSYGQQKESIKNFHQSFGTHNKANFSVKPFTPSFVQNKGQFDKYDIDGGKIDFTRPSYGGQMGNTIVLFSGNTIQFVENMPKKSTEDIEGKDKNELKEHEFVNYRQTMTFINSNPNAEFIADKSERQYFTYPDPTIKNGTIKANGWKNLVIKNIYQGIDVEYSFKDEGGIKYSFIIHPRADASLINIKWSGVEDMIIDNSENLKMNSENGIFSDKTPVSYYQNENNSNVKTSFVLKGTTLSFHLSDYDHTKTLVIDPWINNPNFAGHNSAYDIQHDPSGNIYIYGGANPYQLQKYTSLGAPIWTYNTAAGGYYGDFTIDSLGNAYCIYGPWGDASLKVDPAGSLVWTGGALGCCTTEIYRIAPNHALGQLSVIGMTMSPTNAPMIMNVDMNTGTYSSFFVHPTCRHGETRCMSVDANGDAFGIVYSAGAFSGDSLELLWKVDATNTTTGSVMDGYNLGESQPSNTDSYYSGYNGTTVNACAIYTYDGMTVKKWDKTTLTQLGSVPIPGGIAYVTAGLCSDSCGNIFVGGPDSIFEFDNNLNYLTAVSTNGNQVYDVNNGNVPGEILACGQGFFGSFSFPVCTTTSTDTAQTINIVSCSSPLTLNPTTTGSSYLWSTGATTYSISVTAAGTYWVSVTGASACAQTVNVSDTFNVTFSTPPLVNLGNDTSICGNGPLTLNAGNPGDTYTWSTGATTQTISVNTSGNYWVHVDSGGCIGADSILVNFVTNPVVNLGPDTSICTGNNITLNAGNSGFNFLWSTGATTQTINVNSAGNYSVIVSVGACTGTDTIHINVVNPPTVNLGNDTSICSGQQVTLNAGNPGDSYQWSTGATTQTITATTSGTYWVHVSNGGCVSTDSLAITVVNNPTVNLGPDSTVCIGTTVTLNAGNAGYNYLWNTGATTQTITVNTAGNYWVYVNIGACAGSDTIHLTTVNPPVVNLGNDTSVCSPLTVTLNAGNAGDFYLWSSGAISQTITANTSGTYWVLVNNGHCSTADSINVQIVPTPSVSLGPDTSICLGQSLSFDAGNSGDTYLWSTGATTQTINVDSAGTYWVRVNNGNCKSLDTTTLTVITPPTPDLGGDKVICGITGTIAAGVTAPHYLWSTGDTTSTINVYAPGGTYWLVASQGMCWKSDSINVSFVHDSDYWSPPNVFTPNADGKNDYFIPGIVSATNYDLKIFNRWGELMFETNNPLIHWDGKNKNSDVPEGCYYWLAKYALGCEPDTIIKDKGFVMLYRDKK